MATTDQVEAKLDPDAALDAAITESKTVGLATARAMSPSGRVGWLERALSELELDSGCLDAARQLVAAERDLGRRQTAREMAARQRRQETLAGLANDPGGDLDAAAAAFVAEAAWLDIPVGAQHPPAVGLVRNVRRTIEARVDGAVAAQAPRVFDMVRGKVVEVVAEVAALPPLPDVWSLSNAAEELAKRREHRSTWGTLVAARQDFDLCHAVAELFRDHLGYGPDALTVSGAPGWALAWRNWRPILGDPLWPTVRKELKLPYAVQHGYQPGLWVPSEVEVKPEDKTWGARLRNLGFAVRS